MKTSLDNMSVRMRIRTAPTLLGGRWSALSSRMRVPDFVSGSVVRVARVVARRAASDGREPPATRSSRPCHLC
jgi:hypothetical protein